MKRMIFELFACILVVAMCVPITGLKTDGTVSTSVGAPTEPPELGQTKVKEGFETWPPAGWCYSGIVSFVQTTGYPGGECMIGHHAAKIYMAEYHRVSLQKWGLLFNGEKGYGRIRLKMLSMGYRFFGQLTTPTFNGKKGGGNILTFWHKQLISADSDQLVIFVTNDLWRSCVQVAQYPSSMSWTYETLNLNDFIRPTKTMGVLFLVICHDGSTMYLDQVTITGVSGE